jgi:hypothetical protein
MVSAYFGLQLCVVRKVGTLDRQRYGAQDRGKIIDQTDYNRVNLLALAHCPHLPIELRIQ